MFKKMVPRLSVKTIYDIDLKALWEAGIRGIITDLDNTLVGAKHPAATPELTTWLSKVSAMGFKVVIVSNNNELRVSRFSDPLKIPYISAARKPGNTPFRRALGMMDLNPEQAVVVGDQMLTDVLGGNRLGLHTILVVPISLKDEGFFTRINRRVEKMALKWMRKNGLMKWDD